MNARLLDRRDWLKAITALTTSAGASCSTTTTSAPASSSPHRQLAAVTVAPERVIDTVVGLRPFRRPGFRVEVERLGEKVIIHNYGHGGCGVTLSWGTAQLALEQALETPYRQAAVLGAGAVGLATARLFQDHGFDVTIYARDLPPNTTSNVAGAQWAPDTIIDNEYRTSAFDDLLVEVSVFAHRYFQSLVGDRYGVRWLDAYEFADSPDGHDGWYEGQLLADLFPKTSLEPGEHSFGSRSVSHYPSMHIDPAIYLRAMMADVRLAGGTIVIRDFPDVEAVVGLEQPLVVNCTSLGARELFDDDEMVPIKGQIAVLRPQPEIDYLTYTVDGSLYMMPRRSGIILGGTRERGTESLEPDPLETERILEGHRRLFGEMT